MIESVIKTTEEVRTFVSVLEDGCTIKFGDVSIDGTGKITNIRRGSIYDQNNHQISRFTFDANRDRFNIDISFSHVTHVGYIIGMITDINNKEYNTVENLSVDPENVNRFKNELPTE